MALFSTYKKKSILKAAIKQTKQARKNEGAKADQLYLSANEAYADVVKNDLLLADALYNWGFALLHQAKTKEDNESIKLYQDSINKFSFCLLIEPDYLGAAIDGGVAFMDLARVMNKDKDEYYNLAKESFDNAERIQKGSAAYNLACIYGIRGQDKACLEAMEISKKYGSLPDPEEIVNDIDLVKVKSTQWFTEFMERVDVDPEPEIVDENAVVYDEEGKVVKEKVKDVRKNPETEVDGIVYDVEGNIIRKMDSEEPVEIELEEKIEINETSSKEESTKNEQPDFVDVEVKDGFASNAFVKQQNSEDIDVDKS